MTTTINMDDDLYQAASVAAKAQGKSFSDFVAEALRAAVASSGPPCPISKNGLRVMVVPEGTPTIDPAKVRQAIEEEGF